MIVQAGCHSCVKKQAETLALHACSDEKINLALHQEFKDFFERMSKVNTPPEMASYYFRRYSEVSGIADPFREEKDKSTALALKLLPRLRQLVESADDPFAAAVKIASGSNIIDYGVLPDLQLEQAEAAITAALASPIDPEAVKLLAHRAKAAKRILYILDNCGEAVLDKLLLEQLPAGKVTLGVRGRFIFNDVTRREIPMSGLEAYMVIDTGDGAPGVSLRDSAPEFLAAMAESDLIIAKGQGNFESLESTFTTTPIFYLFRVKCKVISETFALPLDSLQIQAHNL